MGDTDSGMRGREAVKGGVEEDDFREGLGCAGRTGEGAAGEEGGAELRAEEAAAAGDEDTHGESEGGWREREREREGESEGAVVTRSAKAGFNRSFSLMIGIKGGAGACVPRLIGEARKRAGVEVSKGF